MTPKLPLPDPGNSPPEAWTQPLTEQEIQEVRDLLKETCHDD